MSLIARLAPAFTTIQNSLFSSVRSLGPMEGPQGGFTQTIRTIIRCHFPRPSERKRVKKHGWNKRLSTDGGRKTLMRRILKGRHVYSH